MLGGITVSSRICTQSLMITNRPYEGRKAFTVSFGLDCQTNVEKKSTHNYAVCAYSNVGSDAGRFEDSILPNKDIIPDSNGVVIKGPGFAIHSEQEGYERETTPRALCVPFEGFARWSDHNVLRNHPELSDRDQGTLALCNTGCSSQVTPKYGISLNDSLLQSQQ